MNKKQLTLAAVTLLVSFSSYAVGIIESDITTWSTGPGMSCGTQAELIESVDITKQSLATWIDQINTSTEEKKALLVSLLPTLEQSVKNSEELLREHQQRTYIFLIVKGDSLKQLGASIKTPLGSVELQRISNRETSVNIYGEDVCKFDNNRLSKKAAISLLNSLSN